MQTQMSRPQIDTVRRAKAYVKLYSFGGALALFGTFMFCVFVSEDLRRENIIPPGPVALGLCCLGIAACSFYTAFQYWQDAGQVGPHDRRGINARSAVMACVALAAAAAAYSNYPLPISAPVSGSISDIVVDDGDDFTKLDFRINGRPFAFDCLRKKGGCPQRKKLVALASAHPHTASVIPVGGTILSLQVDGDVLLNEASERRWRTRSAMNYLLLALLFGGVAWGDWRQYPIFRKAFRTKKA
jgi:hypothetical protein